MSGVEDRCVECGTEVATISDTPLCSKDCQIEYAHRMVREMSNNDAWCPTCYKNLNSIKSVCYHHNKNHSFKIHRNSICKNCGERFVPSNSGNEMKYCSRECFGMDNRVDMDVSNCKNCGNEIYHYPKHSRKFCSRECANGGKFHWNWSGGSDSIRETSEYRQWRESIYNKYDGCEKCGSTDNLHAHHIVPVSVNKDLATDVDNGKLLCQSCHSKEHPNVPNGLFVSDNI